MIAVTISMVLVASFSIMLISVLMFMIIFAVQVH